MKLCRFSKNDSVHIGKIVGDTVVDLSQVTGPRASMRQLLEGLTELRAALEDVSGPSFPLPMPFCWHRSMIRRNSLRSA